MARALAVEARGTGPRGRAEPGDHDHRLHEHDRSDRHRGMGADEKDLQYTRRQARDGCRFFVPRILAERRNGALIAWLTGGKIFWRFATAGFARRKVIDEEPPSRPCNLLLVTNARREAVGSENPVKQAPGLAFVINSWFPGAGGGAAGRAGRTARRWGARPPVTCFWLQTQGARLVGYGKSGEASPQPRVCNQFLVPRGGGRWRSAPWGGPARNLLLVTNARREAVGREIGEQDPGLAFVINSWFPRGPPHSLDGGRASLLDLTSRTSAPHQESPCPLALRRTPAARSSPFSAGTPRPYRSSLR